ncbi:MAG: UDP-N-acetylmuramoyl-L-alanine--D-glutamate ligase [Pyrinomonadaceae bacterium]
MEISGKKALVLGAGKSGIESAKFLASRGAVVALHDKKDLDDWTDAAKALGETRKVGLISGTIPSWLLDQIDLVVISPGVPTNSIPARYVDRKDGEVIGEVELAYRFLRGRIVAITGSNGKTTTTTLIGEILKQSRIEFQVGGNIGTPLLSLTETSRESGWTIAELSSFQLETIKDFRPNVAVCLNVTPNHLDRYESFTEYAAAKHRIFMNHTSDDFAILNADDDLISSWAQGLRSNVTFFSVEKELEEGLFVRGDDIVRRTSGKEQILIKREDIFLRGLHNVENVLASLAAGFACGAPIGSMTEAVRNFRGVEHRIEFVTEIDGVEFYNDSKATSVDATLKALEAMSGGRGKTILIIGGRGKNAPYSPLRDLILSSVGKLVLIGEDAANIETQLGTYAECVHVDSMADAVEAAFSAAVTGDTVLLAPACASFDMFAGFEERGRAFKAAVAGLALGK